MASSSLPPKLLNNKQCLLRRLCVIIEHEMPPPKGYKQSPEWVEKRRLARLGYTHSPETREKIRQSHLEHPERHRSWLGRKHTTETKEKVRNYALNMAPEHRRKLSEVAKQRAQAPEFREMSRLRSLGNQWALGYRHTPDRREKILQARLRQ